MIIIITTTIPPITPPTIPPALLPPLSLSLSVSLLPDGSGNDVEDVVDPDGDVIDIDNGVTVKSVGGNSNDDFVDDDVFAGDMVVVDDNDDGVPESCDFEYINMP